MNPMCNKLRRAGVATAADIADLQTRVTEENWMESQVQAQQWKARGEQFLEQDQPNFEQAMVAFRRAGDQEGEFKAMARFLQQKAFKLENEHLSAYDDSNDNRTPDSATDSDAKHLIRQSYFDAGYAFLQVGDVDAASRMMRRAGETAYSDRLLLLSTGPREEDDCVICFEARANVRLVPCGHVCMCDSCAPEVVALTEIRAAHQCPVCRAEVKSCTNLDTGVDTKIRKYSD